MKQHEHGHPAITNDAVHQLFSGTPGAGEIHGMHEDGYYKALDGTPEWRWQDGGGQHYADRLNGDTWHPAWADPSAQRRHAMADPNKLGPENVQDIHDFIVNEMVGALSLRESGPEEWIHLGAAVHAIQDSYSSAHMWRDFNVYNGDPTAPIESINVFDPLSLTSGGQTQGIFVIDSVFARAGTHAFAFDNVATDSNGHVTSGSGMAAVAATLALISAYEAARSGRKTGEQAIAEFDAVISQYINATPTVDVNKTVDDKWKKQLDKRLEREHKPPRSPIKTIAIAGGTATLLILAAGMAFAHSHSQSSSVRLGAETHHYKVTSAAGTVVAKYSDQSGSALSSKGSGTSTTRYTCCASSSVQANGVLSGANGNGGSIGPSASQMTFDGSASNSHLQCTVTYPQSSPAPSDLPSIATTMQGQTVHAVWSVLPIEVGGIGGPRNCPFLATLNIPYDEENRLFGKDYPLSTFAQSAPFTISITAHYTDKA